MVTIDDRGANVTVLAFSGLAPRNHCYEWIGALAARTVNVVGVRDPANAWWQGSVVETAEAIADALDSLGRTRTVFIGGSAGGYGALLFGHLLGADRVLAIAPQSACGAVKRSLGDLRWPGFCERVPSSPWADLSRFKPAGTIHFAADEPLDVMHAMRLGPRAVLVEHPGGGHDLPHALKSAGRLAAIIDEALAW